MALFKLKCVLPPRTPGPPFFTPLHSSTEPPSPREFYLKFSPCRKCRSSLYASREIRLFDRNNVPCNCRSSTVFLIVRCVVSEITEECAHLLRFFTGVELDAFTIHYILWWNAGLNLDIKTLTLWNQFHKVRRSNPSIRVQRTEKRTELLLINWFNTLTHKCSSKDVFYVYSNRLFMLLNTIMFI